jgi:5-hydroxyisourate hydrolase
MNLPRLSTHVLDTTTGKPAANIKVSLTLAGQPLAETVTNPDGRAVLLDSEFLHTGVYELIFSIADYFQTPSAPPFLGDVAIRFGIADGTVNCHVPVLVAPYGYSTYRGS